MSERIARIEWIDSSIQNGQVDHTDYPEPTRITSAGIVISSDETGVLLARDSMGGGDFRGLMAIPRCCVLEETDLREPA